MARTDEILRTVTLAMHGRRFTTTYKPALLRALADYEEAGAPFAPAVTYEVPDAMRNLEAGRARGKMAIAI